MAADGAAQKDRPPTSLSEEQAARREPPPELGKAWTLRRSVWGTGPHFGVVRGLAIALVLCLHVWFLWPGDPLMGGYEGVTIFFVLSGFLITSLLLEEHGTRDRISIGGFYRRRAFRLLPALYLVLIAANDGSRVIPSVASSYSTRRPRPQPARAGIQSPLGSRRLSRWADPVPTAGRGPVHSR